MKCPLCNSNTHQRKEVDLYHLSELYFSSFNIDITALITQALYFYHCPTCDFRFFAQKDEKIPTGNDNFYNSLNKISWYYCSEKHEYGYAKQFVKPQDKVLEVGCGKAAFAKYIPQAKYTGLEFSTDAKKMAQENGITIENISIQEYSKSHLGEFDVVCSFQVLEHVSDPHSFIQAKVDSCRGGGQIIIAVPSEDSFIKYAVNGILNMPPHHIGRFTDKCLINIAKLFDLKLINLYHENVQPQHINFYKSVMFSKKLFTPQLLSSNPLRRIANRLGRLFEKVPKNAYGHTVVAIYQKP